MAIQLKRNQPKASKAAGAVPFPKEIPKEAGKLTGDLGPPPKKGTEAPKGNTELTKEPKKEDVANESAQKKTTKKSLAEMASEVASTEKSSAGVGERVGAFLDLNAGLVTASIMLPTAYILAEGVENKGMILATLGASAAIMAQARLPGRDLNESLKKRAIDVMTNELEEATKVLEEEQEEVDRKILEVQETLDGKNSELAAPEAKIERVREEEKKLASQNVTRDTLQLYKDLRKMRELGVGGPLISEMSKGIKHLLDRELPPAKMRHALEKILNGSVLNQDEWQLMMAKEFFAEPDTVLPRTLKMLGVEGVRAEIPLLNAAKTALSSAVGSLTTAISRYPAAFRQDTQSKIDSIREANATQTSLTEKKLKLEEASLEGSGTLSLLQNAESIREKVAQNKELGKSKSALENALKVGESSLAEVMEAVRILQFHCTVVVRLCG